MEQLVAFGGELDFDQFSKSRSHTSMNEGSPRLDDDCDLIVMAVTEPVEGHVARGLQ